MLIALSSVLLPNAQNIVKGEYFFNTDPGFGKGQAIQFAHSASIDTEIEIDFPTGLPLGFNTLYLRFMNEKNVWSHKVAKSVYVDSKSTANSQTLVKGEYFFNDDPGYGQGTPISVKPGNIPSDVEIGFPADLPLGFNTLYIRFVDDKNIWSQNLPRAVFVEKEINAKITKIEYYFSSVSGDSPHYTFDDFEPAPVIDFSESDFLANTSLLEYGKQYTLFARALNSDGKYSPYSSTSFTFKKLVTGLDDVLGQDESFTIYPNPVQDVLYFKGGKELESNLINFAIYDQAGKLLKGEKLQDPQINVSCLKAGQYYIVIYYDKNVFGKNFIKK
jgi:hypothetical protein